MKDLQEEANIVKIIQIVRFYNYLKEVKMNESARLLSLQFSDIIGKYDQNGNPLVNVKEN